MPPPTFSLLVAREQSVGSQDALAFNRALHFPTHFASKLTVEHTYQGHGGCVNRLAWNEDGSRLVSGSDDRRAIIWHYPDVHRTPLALTTEHRANLFGAQFLPCTGDRRIITGAMDDTVQLHDLEDSPAAGGGGGGSSARSGRQGAVGGGPAAQRRTGAASNLQLVMPRTKVYLSHKDRVKDVKVEPLNPHNFWSAGEDGLVRQYDTRAPNQDSWESPTVLVQVRDGHRTVQVKGMDINKAHPHLMAVAGSDPHIRIYDRRKLAPGVWRRRGATQPLMSLAPPHLPLAASGRYGKSHATYVSFSNRGDKVATTYHGDHAYCFDVTSAGEVAGIFPQPRLRSPLVLPAAAASGRAGTGMGTGHRRDSCGAAASEGTGARGDWKSTVGADGRDSTLGAPLHPRAEEAKARGNIAMFERKWSAAVAAFGEALHFAPASPVLYALRAEALMGRGWVGDAGLALRDCDTAVALDESFSRAYLRRIQALQALQQYQCALAAVVEYRRRFPGRAAAEVEALASQLRVSADERRRMYEARRQQQERRRVQRAEALARAPRMGGFRRSYGSPRSEPGTGTVAAAGREAASTSGTQTPTPRAATVASTVPSTAPAPPASGDAASGGTAATTTVMPAATSTAVDAVGPLTAPGVAGAAAASPAAGDGRDTAMAAGREGSPAPSDEVYGPPPPPPPQPHEGANPFEVDSDTEAASAGLPVASTAAAAPGVGPDSAFWQRLRDAQVGRSLSGVLETDEEEEEDDGDGDGDEEERRPAVRRRQGGGEAEDEGQAGDDDADSGDSDSGWSPAEGDQEADPDLELFLQFYAQAVELAGGPDGPSCSGAASSRDRMAGRASPRAAGDAATAPPHLRGAWGGSAGGRRMLQRYVGQCNVQTDIKEVNFIGSDDRVLAAGSDCGRVFLYDADSGAVLRALAADEDVANCVQCHPRLPVLATSGIENVVRLWSPADSLPTPTCAAELAEELARVVERNQERSREGPSYLR
ncbi:hypothetical protein GPECTOR_1g132 [Gonium pectorale]|uniref:Uncharacterized protein n=1 Tax=Gonium pectorale TaxID=33097 RepID=A0A150H271_GONPE|nr:hypothetical protein GPECTOR_1g132 [Gonium pectorale]|eukprot:KXZ56155.1 hypothetical protein GPECTOR_1g132 [Gonium pectorale]